VYEISAFLLKILLSFKQYNHGTRTPTEVKIFVCFGLVQ
jgi:hypothetical protein